MTIIFLSYKVKLSFSKIARAEIGKLQILGSISGGCTLYINIFIFSFIQTSFNFSLVEFRPVIVHNQWHGVVDPKIKERPFLKFVDLFSICFSFTRWFWIIWWQSTTGKSSSPPFHWKKCHRNFVTISLVFVLVTGCSIERLSE